MDFALLGMKAKLPSFNMGNYIIDEYLRQSEPIQMANHTLEVVDGFHISKAYGTTIYNDLLPTSQVINCEDAFPTKRIVRMLSWMATQVKFMTYKRQG